MKILGTMVAAVLAAGAVSVMAMGPAQAADPVVKPPSLANPRGFDSKDGEFLYHAICQGCHMSQGQGATGAGSYPALANDPRLGSPYYPMTLVLNGQKAMPAFGGMLDDEQVAAVVNYVRTHFGNHYTDPATPEQVGSLRK